MKKIIAAILSAMVGLFGYTLVDTAIEARVSTLENEVAVLKSQVAEFHDIAIEDSDPADEMTKAEFVAFLNAETAKAANGSYDFNRNCSYINPVDVGSATSVLNKIIQSIDESSDLNSVVGDFLGIGTKKGSYPQNYLNDDYQIKATNLTVSDLANYTVSNGVYSFTLSDVTNPKKTGATSFSKFTNDFVTEEEVADGIAEVTTAIKVKGSNVNYKNIKVTVTVTENKITNIRYSYTFDATLEIQAVAKITGKGSAETTAEFSNIVY